MRTRFLVPSCLSLLLAACGSGTSTPDGSGAVSGNHDVALAATGPLAAWDDRLDQLLPIEVVAAIVGLPPEQAQTRHGAGGNLRYEWPSARQREYAGMQLPVKNVVEIGRPRHGITPAFFRSRFEPLDSAQQQLINQAVDREIAKRGLDANAGETARSLIGTFSERAPVVDVPGIGDDAVWEQARTPVLHVRIGSSALAITVDVDDSDDIDQAAAIALSQALIERL
jgi:hypothetical protein